MPLLLAFVQLLLLSASPPPGDDWIDVASRRCGFGLAMPPTVEAVADTVQIEGVAAWQGTFYAVVEYDAYTARCTLLPEGTDADALLREATREYEGAGAIHADRPDTLGGYAGRAFAVRLADLHLYRRTYVAGRRLIQLTASRRTEAAPGDEALQRFFGSLRID